MKKNLLFFGGWALIFVGTIGLSYFYWDAHRDKILDCYPIGPDWVTPQLFAVIYQRDGKIYEGLRNECRIRE